MTSKAIERGSDTVHVSVCVCACLACDISPLSLFALFCTTESCVLGLIYPLIGLLSSSLALSLSPLHLALPLALPLPLLSLSLSPPDSNKYYRDDWAVVTLIQGVCFKGLERFDEAQQCFEAIIER